MSNHEIKSDVAFLSITRLFEKVFELSNIMEISHLL